MGSGFSGLNGTTILAADLSTVTEFLDNKPHPGKDRIRGHFGFAGHNDLLPRCDYLVRGLKKLVSSLECATEG